MPLLLICGIVSVFDVFLFIFHFYVVWNVWYYTSRVPCNKRRGLYWLYSTLLQLLQSQKNLGIEKKFRNQLFPLYIVPQIDLMSWVVTTYFVIYVIFIEALLWRKNTLQYYANFIAYGKTTLMQHEFCLSRFVWKVTLPVGRQLWCNILKNTQQCILFQSRLRSGLIWMATMLWWINTFLKC